MQRLVAVELSAAAGAAAAGAASSSVLLFLLPLLLYRRCCRLTAPTDMGLLLRAPSLQRVVWCTPVSCACHHLPGAREQLERHAHKHGGRHCPGEQHWAREGRGGRERRASTTGGRRRRVVWFVGCPWKGRDPGAATQPNRRGTRHRREGARPRTQHTLHSGEGTARCVCCVLCTALCALCSSPGWLS